MRSATMALIVALTANTSARAQNTPTVQDKPPPLDLPPMVLAKKNFDRSLLAPVEGVTLEQDGQASYLLFYDPDAKTSAVLARLHLTQAQFDKATQAFTARMQQDRTGTLIDLFGAYFNEAARGTYAPLGRDVAISVLENKPLREKAPMAEAKFREIQGYYGRKASVAGTALDKQDDVLKPYGITFNDFNIIGAWFARRTALEAPGLADTVDRGPPDAPSDPRQHPEWGGLWRFTWELLERTDAGMVVARKTRDICLKAGMDAATLPIMPKPRYAKCVLIGGVDFFESNIAVQAQCDHGAFGSSWSLQLETPLVKGKSYRGEITFNMENEHLADLPAPQTPVSAQRLGDCP